MKTQCTYKNGTGSEIMVPHLFKPPRFPFVRFATAVIAADKEPNNR